MRPSPKAPASGRGVGRAPKRDDKLVTSEATTSPDGGDSSAEEGARGRASEAPAFGPRRAPAGDEAICVSSALDWEPGGGGGCGGRGGALRHWSEATPRRWGVQTPSGAGYPREGEKATCGSCRECASAEDNACAGGNGNWGGGKRTHQQGRCWSRPECVRGRDSG